MKFFSCSVIPFLAIMLCLSVARTAPAAEIPNATSLRGKVMCGYQGWFRCPGDDANLGWVHWSRDSRRITPETLTFEMWPDMTEYAGKERFPAPGFTYSNGRRAELFSSDNAATVLRHLEWMRDYGIDGAWLQRFLVGLPGTPALPHCLARDAPCREGRTGDGPSLGDFVRHGRHALGPHL